MRSYKKKGGEGCKTTYKLALLKLDENEKKIFSKGIMREQLLKLKKIRQISKKLTKAMMNDITVN